jgi:hypothetical protein
VRVQVPLRVRYRRTAVRLNRLHFAEVAQLVEHNLAKVRVAGSSPVFRSLPKGLVILRNSGAFYYNKKLTSK